jgi:CheY-like chemotaxis protein
VGTLYADKQRVRQVLLNLVGNACKFTEHGTVSLSASRLHDNGDESIVFEVADTGRGMTPQEQAKLFTPFTKLAARQGNRTGTGLGLVISKGFCEMMHGQITLQSEYGKGSTFTVCLPANTAAQGGDKAESGTEAMHARPKGATRHIATNPAQAAEAAAGLAKGLRAAHGDDIAAPLTADAARTVLVIDDDAAVREVMTRYLEGRGFQVVTAVNGLEGLEKAERLLPAVITLDAVMPGLDGWGVLAALKVNRQTKDIPVIMVTITDDVQRSYSLGAAEFLTKPVDWALLSDVLARYTGNKRDGSILIVDDESEAREILRRNLERDGWKVLEAAHGAAALELLATEQPAAILLDLMMPVMDGFEFLAQYCQLAEWLSIPVIVVTAKDPTPDELARLDGVVVRVLRKGQFTQDELLKEIHRRVDQHIRA